MPGHPFSVPFQPVTTRDCPGEALPQPARGLLAHDRDLTPTLESHHRSPLHIRVLQAERRGDRYHRRVVLITADGRAVSQGEIEIHLDRLPSPIVDHVLAGRSPWVEFCATSGFPTKAARKRSLPSIQPRTWKPCLGSPARPCSTAGATICSRRRDVFAEVLEILAPSDKLPPP